MKGYRMVQTVGTFGFGQIWTDRFILRLSDA